MSSSKSPLHMRFAVPELAEGARRCETAAFDTKHDLGREAWDAAHKEYEDQSVFLTISDDSDHVHASARFVLPGPAGFVSMNEMPEFGWTLNGYDAAREVGLDLTSTWDIASFSRDPGSPGGNRLALALAHGLILAGKANGVSAMVALLDERVRGYLAMYGLMYVTLPGAATLPYFGSPATTPVYARYHEFIDTIRRSNPEGYRLVGLGVGLDGITVPPLSYFELSPPPHVIDLIRDAAPLVMPGR